MTSDSSILGATPNTFKNTFAYPVTTTAAVGSKLVLKLHKDTVNVAASSLQFSLGASDTF